MWPRFSLKTTNIDIGRWSLYPPYVEVKLNLKLVIFGQNRWKLLRFFHFCAKMKFVCFRDTCSNLFKIILWQSYRIENIIVNYKASITNVTVILISTNFLRMIFWWINTFFRINPTFPKTKTWQFLWKTCYLYLKIEATGFVLILDQYHTHEIIILLYYIVWWSQILVKTWEYWSMKFCWFFVFVFNLRPEGGG